VSIIQSISPLVIKDFEKSALIILGKAEVDSNGLGNFVELEEVTDFSIQSNITNIFQNTCAMSFSINLTNTKDKYSLYDKGASHYGYIKEGRKIRLYIGATLKPDAGVHADYYWSWIYGIIDKPSMSYSETSEMCSITGRDYIAYLSETYLKKLWWGTNLKFNVEADKEKYSMPINCTGIYRVFLDKTGTRTAFKEITLNSEYTYDWQTNELVFLIPSVPTENAAGCLWIYYHTAINVATLVADLLTEAEIMNAAERYLWLANTNLCTPTSKTIQRAWFDSGTNYITAINMLTEVATIYRFYINGEGNPCFKQIPLLSTTIKRIDDAEYLIKNTEERLDELYNHFIIIGEYREMKKMNLGVIAYTTLYDLLTTSGELRGAILDNGGFTLTSRGFKWQATGGAEQDWHQHTSSIGYYTHEITGLTPDTEYKFCAYGTNAGGDKKQSPDVYFKTLPEEI